MNEHFSCAALELLIGSRADNWRRQGGLLSNKVCTGTQRNLWYERLDSSSHSSAPFFNLLKAASKSLTSHQGLCLAPTSHRATGCTTRGVHLSALVRECIRGEANREREAGERQVRDLTRPAALKIPFVNCDSRHVGQLGTVVGGISSPAFALARRRRPSLDVSTVLSASRRRARRGLFRPHNFPSGLVSRTRPRRRILSPPSRIFASQCRARRTGPRTLVS